MVSARTEGLARWDSFVCDVETGFRDGGLKQDHTIQ